MAAPKCELMTVDELMTFTRSNIAQRDNLKIQIRRLFGSGELTDEQNAELEDLYNQQQLAEWRLAEAAYYLLIALADARKAKQTEKEKNLTPTSSKLTDDDDEDFDIIFPPKPQETPVIIIDDDEDDIVFPPNTKVARRA